MTHLSRIGPALCASAFLLAGCAAGGTASGSPHLSATQCSDLTALRENAPPNHARNMSELAALEEAGYHPELRFDPEYPEDLHAAQRRVDGWYRHECPQAHRGGAHWPGAPAPTTMSVLPPPHAAPAP